jgi:hypothetical protein
MHTVFDALTPKEAAFAVAAVCAALIVYALVYGRVFLMPYTVARKDNPRAFYVLLAIVAFLLISSLVAIFRRA